MSELVVVTGNDCLEYIDKPIGFGSHEYIDLGNQAYSDIVASNNIYVQGREDNHSMNYRNGFFSTTLQKWHHNTNKRVVGLVLDESPEGGLEVALLGNETIVNRGGRSISVGDCEYYSVQMHLIGEYDYETPVLLEDYKLDLSQLVGGYPTYSSSSGNPRCWVVNNTLVTNFDSAIDLQPEKNSFLQAQPFGCIWEYAHNLTTSGSSYTLTNNKDNTMVFGVILDLQDSYYYPTMCAENPLNLIGGNLYSAISTINFRMEQVLPARIPLGDDFNLYKFYYPDALYLERTNLTALPFNIILTRSEQYAKNYLNTGTLPPDAFLYPLDWTSLPGYDDPVPTGDTPEDYDDDNTPDDDTRDFDPMPVETPTFTVNQLSNYNWYWLDVTQWHNFINWFWNDVGNYNDFDDIIAKVKGLYNDLASSVIMCRYYPVEVGWIGGTGIQSNIKIGMIEKEGLVDTLANTALRVQDIGHVHIGGKYKSFMDMSPYSQLSLYLPWHGFIDIDVNLFTGHDLYVKALYDYMSGTIQYYIYYDNEIPVNTILCKMAMDIPITLQTKNDRDSAIFNNVSSTIGGLVGAGVGVASGNPIGMVMGVTQGIGAINSSTASAPMRLMGNVGESGAYIGCQYCAIVVRRPTIQPSDGNSQTSITKGLGTWKHNVGMLCGYGYTLNDLKGQGFTVCHTPRIDFKNTAPMQSEVDEIYSYLEKGVIL